MPSFDHIVGLLEAKGWYLYEARPGATFPQIVSGGRVRTLRSDIFYYLMPAIVHDTSVDAMHEAIVELKRANASPVYNDGVNSGPVNGVSILAGKFVFASKPDAFLFDLDSEAVVEDAIKFNLSNYHTLFLGSIDEVRGFLDKQQIAPQRPSVLPSQLRWTLVQSSQNSDMAAIYPENPSKILFRGQVTRHRPCLSTATRGLGVDNHALFELSEPHQVRLIANFIRTEWFNSLLRETTVAAWLKEQRIVMDETAIAQHYGLPTGYIDLTELFEVATFFASCRFDVEKKSWSPVAEGEGVIYAVHRLEVPRRYSVQPINLQFFPRPSEQWGWTCEMQLGQDFDKLPFVWKFVFKHDPEISRRIHEKFSQGKDLFPEDPLSELADEVIKSQSLPLFIAEWIAKDLIDDPQGRPGSTVADILALLRKNGIALTESVTISAFDKINRHTNSIWQQRRDSFFKGVGFHLVREKRE